MLNFWSKNVKRNACLQVLWNSSSFSWIRRAITFMDMSKLFGNGSTDDLELAFHAMNCSCNIIISELYIRNLPTMSNQESIDFAPFLGIVLWLHTFIDVKVFWGDHSMISSSPKPQLSTTTSLLSMLSSTVLSSFVKAAAVNTRTTCTMKPKLALQCNYCQGSVLMLLSLVLSTFYVFV